MLALNAARPAPERTGNRPHELSLLAAAITQTMAWRANFERSSHHPESR